MKPRRSCSVLVNVALSLEISRRSSCADRMASRKVMVVGYFVIPRMLKGVAQTFHAVRQSSRRHTMTASAATHFHKNSLPLQHPYPLPYRRRATWGSYAILPHPY
jgi:hypothetical protein